MKNLKRILTVLLIAAPSLLLAQSGNYTIIGKVGISSPSKKVYLLNVEDATGKMDSALSVNGNFTFKGTVTEPTLYWIIVKGKEDDGRGFNYTRNYHCFKFFAISGVIKIISADSIANAKVTGGLVNKEYDGLRIIRDKIYGARMRKIDDEFFATPPEKRKSKEFRDSAIKKEDAAAEDLHVAEIKFAKAHTNSFAGLRALFMYTTDNPSSPNDEQLFNMFSVKMRSSEHGKIIAKMIAETKAVAIGSPAPDFTMADTTGKMVSLHDFKGKYVLVDFWASWCGPCRAENPNVVKAYAQFKGKGFEILGVSLDGPKSKDAWLKAIKTDNLTWTEVSDLKGWGNEAAKMYNVKGIPQNFLIGPDGTIVASNLTGDDLQNKLTEIFNKM